MDGHRRINRSMANPYLFKDRLPVWHLFTNCRLDITACGKESIHAHVVAVCHETNLQWSRAYTRKYRLLKKKGSALAAGRYIVSHFIEMSTLGFISNLSNFKTALKITKMSKLVKNKIFPSAIKSSFKIYCNRNMLVDTID